MNLLDSIDQQYRQYMVGKFEELVPPEEILGRKMSDEFAKLMGALVTTEDSRLIPTTVVLLERCAGIGLMQEHGKIIKGDDLLLSLFRFIFKAGIVAGADGRLGPDELVDKTNNS